MTMSPCAFIVEILVNILQIPTKVVIFAETLYFSKCSVCLKIITKQYIFH